jgi:hypothetical protein
VGGCEGERERGMNLSSNKAIPIRTAHLLSVELDNKQDERRDPFQRLPKTFSDAYEGGLVSHSDEEQSRFFSIHHHTNDEITSSSNTSPALK